MTIETTPWEHHLLVWAHEALVSPAVEDKVAVDTQTLSFAYDYCKVVVRANSRTFSTGMSFASLSQASGRACPVCVLSRHRRSRGQNTPRREPRPSHCGVAITVERFVFCGA